MSRNVELMWDDLKPQQIKIMSMVEKNPTVTDERLYQIGRSYKLMNELEEVHDELTRMEREANVSNQEGGSRRR